MVRDFICKDFLLKSDIAKKLYHDYAAKMPVIDYHCHVSPEEIAKDRRFSNITQLWLHGDHYKWRLMRAAGVDERFITGAASDYEKFKAFAKVLPKAIGNPVYHWAHLELQRYFDCDLALSDETADAIWDICDNKLSNGNMSVRSIIEKSNVELIITTDDPIDSLEWHKIIHEDIDFKAKILPGIRPDKAINIDKPGFADYIESLSDAAKISVKTFDDLLSALENRLEFFGNKGCITADHGLDYVPFAGNAEEAAPCVFGKALRGESLSLLEIEQYKTALLLFFARQYAKRGWVMQYHYGVLRNNNIKMFKEVGPDTGFDAISSRECSANIASMLATLDETNQLPKTILYSLNPNDNAMLTTIAGCFTEGGVVSKVQHGSAWWFNDTKQGMESHMTNFAEKSLLGGFIGMLTDSRSFLSYTRHEYFRRILCNLMGKWVEDGEYPRDIEMLGKIVNDVSYYNVKRYFDIC